MPENHYEVRYDDYIELKYQLTFELKTLTENVSRITASFEKQLEVQNGRISDLAKCLEENKQLEDNNKHLKAEEATQKGTSLPSNIKWLLVLIMGVAFLGVLGAAIGINLLDHFVPGGP